MAQLQNLSCLNPVDTLDLHFKLIKRCDATQYSENPTHANFLAVANSYGLTFLAANNGFQVIRTNSLSDESYQKKFVSTRCPFVSHLVVNGDETLLAVGGSAGTNGSVAYIYPLATIAGQNYIQESSNVKLSSTAGVAVVEMFWNPTMFNLLSACLSDGSVVLAEVKNGSPVEARSLPPNAAARCFCWSPKGKQFVVGGEDGKLTQYKPDLSPAKIIPAPDVFEGAASVASVIWISNFQFGAVYRNRNQTDALPTLMIVNVFKNEPITFINYGDITYGSQFRFPQFYFHLQPQWNLLFVSSANSVDLGVLYMGQDGRTWVQWVIGDSSRAEMPLTANQDETFPYGMAVDLSSQTSIPWMEAQLPPAPRLLLISNQGVLCLYNIVNLVQGMPAICSAPTNSVADLFFDAPVAVAVAVAQPTVSVKPIVVTPTPVVVPPVAIPVPVVVEPPSPEPPIPQAVNAVISKDEPPPYSLPREPTPPIKEPEPEIDDSVYDAAILEEILALDDDLDNFFAEMSEQHKLEPQEEFSDVVRRLHNLGNFKKDVDETTSSQAEEISELKLDALELTAKSHNARLVSDRHSNRLNNQWQRNEHLDPVLARFLREILGLRTYVESQLKQLSDHLDKQWEAHQQACRKDAKTRLETPMMEDIYKTMNLLKKMLIIQKMTIDDLEKSMERTKGKPRPGQNQFKNDSSRVTDLSKLADSLLGMTISGEKSHSLDVSNLLVNAKRQNVDSCEFTASEISLLFDRFEDSPVPEVSHCLNYADRDAHRKEVKALLQLTYERMQKREKKRLELQENVLKTKRGSVHMKTTKIAPKAEKISEESIPFGKDSFSIKPVAVVVSSAYSSTGSIGNTQMGVKMPESVVFSAKPELSITKVPPNTAKSAATTASGLFSLNPSNKSLFTTQSSGLFGKNAVSTTFTSAMFGNTTAVKSVTEMAETTRSDQKPLFSTYTSTPNSKSVDSTTKSPILVSEPKIKESIIAVAPIETKTTSVPPTSFNPPIGLFSSISAPTPTHVFTLSASSEQTGKIFDSPSGNLFGNVSSTTIFSPATKTTPDIKTTISATTVSTATSTTSLFGSSSKVFSAPATTPTTVSIFSTVATTAALTTTTSSLFGLTKSASSVFGEPATTITSSSEKTTSIFGSPATTTASSLFGNAPIVSAATSPAIFAPTTIATTLPSESAFGDSAPATSIGLFATTTAATPTTGGLFKSVPIALTTISPSLFETTTTTNTTSPGLFSASPTASASTVFGSGSGSTTTTPTTSSSVFRTPLFGNTPTGTTTTDLFSSFTQTPTTSTPGVFGTATLPTAVSGFGADINQTSNLFSQMLNSPTPPSTPQTNIFAQTTANSGFESGASIFGGGAPANTSSMFGSSTTNVFGQTTSPSLFATTSTTTNIFGQATPTTSTSSFFGQNICSPFGTSSTAPNQSPFGSPVAATTQSAFGSSSFNKPIFGQSAFGQSGTTSLFSNNTPQSVSIFGGNTSGSFQTNSFSGPFNSGSGTVAQSGFGAAPSFAKPAAGGFGSAPVFGGTPAATAFGGTPAFGSSLPFGGSPNKVFGTGGSSPVFGQQQPSGFESLATQNTVGFGNLAQMPGTQPGFGSGFPSPQQQQNTFGTPQQQQPSSPSFGGSSFSSWR